MKRCGVGNNPDSMQQIVVFGKGVDTTWEGPRIHPLARRHPLCALRVQLGIGRTVQGNEHRKIHEVEVFQSTVRFARAPPQVSTSRPDDELYGGLEWSGPSLAVLQSCCL